MFYVYYTIESLYTIICISLCYYELTVEQFYMAHISDNVQMQYLLYLILNV